MLKYLVRASGQTHEAPPVLSDLDGDQSQNEKGPSDVATCDNNNEKGNLPKCQKQAKWLKSYGNWLKYDEEKNQMYCTLCQEGKLKNTMAQGTNNFKTTTIDRHLKSSDHRTALSFPKAKQDMSTAIDNADTKEEKSIMLCDNPT